MFARCFIELRSPVATLEDALTRSPESWIPALAREAADTGARLLSVVGHGDERSIDRTFEIAFADPIRVASRTILPVRWTAGAPDALFPALEADLEIAPMGEELTQLSMNARFQPPRGSPGATRDRALLHRVAETTLRDFLERIATALEARVSTEMKG